MQNYNAEDLIAFRKSQIYSLKLVWSVRSALTSNKFQSYFSY